MLNACYTLCNVNQTGQSSRSKSFFCFLLIFFITSILSAQNNIVPNAGFELYDTCPNNQAQLNFCHSWISPTAGTPDYFNGCSSVTAGVPWNYSGVEDASDGSAYSGIYTMLVFGLNYREYIQTRLNQALVAGKKYTISFNVSLADAKNKYAVKNIGAYLSGNPINDMSSTLPLPYLPQVQASTFLADTSGWFNISGTFTATGGEEYITIGNFSDDNNTDTLLLNSTISIAVSYYYIDNISVSESKLFFPSVFTPNADGINDIWLPDMGNTSEGSCTVYSRWGNQVVKLTPSHNGWDGKSESGSVCESGTYYFLFEGINAEGETENRKGFIQLMR